MPTTDPASDATPPAADLTLRSTRLAIDGLGASLPDLALAGLVADDFAGLAADVFADLAADVFAGLADGDFAGLAEALAVEAADLAADFLAPAALVSDDLAAGFLPTAASFERAAIAAPAPVLLSADFLVAGAFDPFAGLAAGDFVEVAMTIPSVGLRLNAADGIRFPVEGANARILRENGQRVLRFRSG